MKMTILSSFFLLSTVSAYAATNCNESIDDFFTSVAPNTKAVVFKGHYTKRSEETGEYKTCEISIKKENDQLVPSWTPEKLDPSNGDGGGLWPFNSFPTTEPESTEYDRVVSYKCSATSLGFSVDYTKKGAGLFGKKLRSRLAVTKNENGTYDVKLVTAKKESAVCRGEASEAI